MAKGKGGDGSKKVPSATASKSSKPSTSKEDDGSHVVFSNAKGDVKPKRSAKPDDEHRGQSQDAPKKPDTKTLIAGASWTGKLPVNLLNEHCQKQRWEKPDYNMVSKPLLFLIVQRWLTSSAPFPRWILICRDSQIRKQKDQGNFDPPSFPPTARSCTNRRAALRRGSPPFRRSLRPLSRLQHAQHAHDAASDLS